MPSLGLSQELHVLVKILSKILESLLKNIYVFLHRVLFHGNKNTWSL